MQGQKKVLSVKLLLVLIVCLLVIAGVAGYTIAKYVYADTTVYSARVAKWDVSVAKAAASVDLFAYTDANVDYDGNGTEKVIAPGTQGLFTYELTNNSEVNALYAVTYTVDEAGVYLQWSTDGVNWTDDLADISSTTIAMGDVVDVNIYWKWAYEADTVAEGQSDANDTALGLNGTAAPSVTIKVTFAQAD